MAILTGHDGFARFWQGAAGALDMTAVRWSVDARIDALDRTSFVNSNFGQYLDGVRDFDISVDLVWDTANEAAMPTTLPSTSQNAVLTAGLQPGCYMAVRLFVTEAHATRFWDFPSVIISDIRVDDSVRDLVRYSVNGKASYLAAAYEYDETYPFE